MRNKTMVAFAAFIIAMLLLPAGASAKSRTIPAKCDRFPALQQVKGSHERARKAWNSKTLKTNGQTIRRVRLQANCVPSDKAERTVRDHIASARKSYKKAVQAAEAEAAMNGLLVYDCGSNGAWAIPCDIVACESGYSWGADNPNSDARGPYQLLGHGEPWPVVTDDDKLAHHQIASDLWAGGSGSGNWAQCL